MGKIFFIWMCSWYGATLHKMCCVIETEWYKPWFHPEHLLSRGEWSQLGPATSLPTHSLLYLIQAKDSLEDSRPVLKASSVPDPWHFVVDPDPRIHASDWWIRMRILLFSSFTFKTPTKNNFKESFSAYYFSKVHLHYFSKIKSPKKITKQ